MGDQITADGLHIRDARSEEAEATFDLWVAAYQDEDVSGDPSDVLRLLGAPSARLLVAEPSGRLVGTLIAAFDGWRGNMYRMAVLPEARRRGVGLALVREAEDWLKSLGCSRITALVVKDHPWATGFWAAAGYHLDVLMGATSTT